MDSSAERKRKFDSDLEVEQFEYRKQQTALIERLEHQRELKERSGDVSAQKDYRDLLREYQAEAKAHEDRQFGLKANFYRLEAANLDSTLEDELNDHYPTPITTHASTMDHRDMSSRSSTQTAPTLAPVPRHKRSSRGSALNPTHPSHPTVSDKQLPRPTVSDNHTLIRPIHNPCLSSRLAKDAHSLSGSVDSFRTPSGPIKDNQRVPESGNVLRRPHRSIKSTKPGSQENPTSSRIAATQPCSSDTFSTRESSSHRRWTALVGHPSSDDSSELRKLRENIAGTSDRLPTRDGLVRSTKSGWWFVDDCPVVVQHRPSEGGEFWYVLECGICGTNVIKSGERFRGITSLQQHLVRSSVCKDAVMTRNYSTPAFILQECLKPLTARQVDAVFADSLNFPPKPAFMNLTAAESSSTVAQAGGMSIDLIPSGGAGWKFVEKCSIIVQHELPDGSQTFYTIHCCICDSNVSARGEYFKGIRGLRAHFKRGNTQCAANSPDLGHDLDKFIIDRCLSPISEKDLALVLAGKLELSKVQSVFQNMSKGDDVIELFETDDSESVFSRPSETPGSPDVQHLLLENPPVRAHQKMVDEPLPTTEQDVPLGQPKSQMVVLQVGPQQARALASRRSRGPQESQIKQESVEIYIP